MHVILSCAVRTVKELRNPFAVPHPVNTSNCVVPAAAKFDPNWISRPLGASARTGGVRSPAPNTPLAAIDGYSAAAGAKFAFTVFGPSIERRHDPVPAQSPSQPENT